ncbi:MAG: gliding motility-associated C-terminal domain-containing protein [Bacteroidetes bacterium]|nr:gliding motility-associated C-terminal domain-containing protein [Bacteroidota bacterium]
MRQFYFFGTFLLCLNWSIVNAQICTPASNDNCANAIALVVNAPAISGNTCGTLEPGEIIDCAVSTSTQSVWYSFVATANILAVSISSPIFCYLSSSVWTGTGGCPVGGSCHAISCQSATNGPATTVHYFNDLVIGDTYYVQILNEPSIICGTSNIFNIDVSTTIPANISNGPQLSTCGAVSGSACVFNYVPTVNTITSQCQSYLNPTTADGKNEVVKACFTFTGQYSTNITFQNVINSTCGTGNVIWFNWELYDLNCNSVSCGGLSNLGTSGIVCGNQYKMCYAYEIPNCTHTLFYPYISAIPVNMPAWTSQSNSSSTASICPGDSVTLFTNAPGYINYSWSPATGLSSTTGPSVKAFPAITTTYTVTGFDSGGCAQSKTIQVIVKPTPVPTINPSNPTLTCTAPTATLTATGGGTYLWSTGTTGASIIVNGQGTYTVTVTGTNTCSATTSALVNQGGSLPTATITPASGVITCSNTSITLTASGGGTYLWSNGVSSTSINVTSANTYSVTVTDSIGCSISTSVSITENKIPPVAGITPSTATLDCINVSATLTASNGGTYLWSTGSSTNSIIATTSGNYSVTVTDSVNGCTGVASSTVSSLPGITITHSVTDISCNGGSNGAVDIQVTGGQAPYTFLWNNQAATEDISLLSEGAYSVTVTDSLGCTATSTATVNEPDSLLITETHHDISCNGTGDGTITLNSTGGTGTITYAWNDGGTGANRNNLDSGNYSATATDVNQCTASVSTTIFQGSQIDVSSTVSDVSCHGGNDGSIDISPRGGNLPYGYQWNDAATSEDRTSVSAGNYKVTITDMNQCSITAEATVSEPTALLFSQKVDQPSCPENGGDGTISVTPSGAMPPYSYSWSNGGNTPDISGLGSGSYSLTITDNNNCTVTASFNLNYLYQFQVNASPALANIEAGQTISLNYQTSGSAGTITSQKWTPSESLSCDNCRSPVAAPDQSTTYQVQVTNNAGCVATDIVTINVSPSFSLYVPNSFTPNADGINDFFEIFGNRQGISFLEIELFNRWGETVFQSNDHSFKWDGLYKGEPLATQTLIWKLKLAFKDKPAEDLRQGSVTLLR